ncbi:glutamate racemase [Geomicrobium sp. JCM 19055]|uniref:glutamate racemase n=1 Tax=Geomicrobium sp. JCM 19055 TaxID=1460649 RepID=UPI00045ED374|nr:glutamate racemase [Geomicrobium sp. JCM 19055]GAJ99315.1 glutamate racemase [Geomicrobium sp. JCM 19055]
MNLPIGVIDSGVGGLTVAKEVARQLPKETMIYIGDTARCPYGPRTVEEVRRFTWQMVEQLLQWDIKMLVIACNTATAVTLEELQAQLDIPVVGVIRPGAIAALNETSSGEIAVIGTEGTIHSGAYPETIRAIQGEQVTVHNLACPPFVPLVEQNRTSKQDAYKIVEETLRPLQQYRYDTLILGCTHYPILKAVIQEVVGGGVSVISSGQETAREMSTILQHNGIHNRSEEAPAHIFYTSGEVLPFVEKVERWMKITTPDVRQISFLSSTMNHD